MTTNELSKLEALHDECFECMSVDCCFNYGEECRYPMVHEEAPPITETDGCLAYYCTDI